MSFCVKAGQYSKALSWRVRLNNQNYLIAPAMEVLKQIRSDSKEHAAHLDWRIALKLKVEKYNPLFDFSWAAISDGGSYLEPQLEEIERPEEVEIVSRQSEHKFCNVSGTLYPDSGLLAVPTYGLNGSIAVNEHTERLIGLVVEANSHDLCNDQNVPEIAVASSLSGEYSKFYNLLKTDLNVIETQLGDLRQNILTTQDATNLVRGVNSAVYLSCRHMLRLINGETISLKDLRK